jgi:hypothetical protein
MRTRRYLSPLPAHPYRTTNGSPLPPDPTDGGLGSPLPPDPRVIIASRPADTQRKESPSEPVTAPEPAR